MKLDYPKEWYARSAELEGDSEVGAGGGPPWVKLKLGRRSYAANPETRIVLGTLVELSRRNLGWNTEQLAQRTGIALEKIIEIERDPNYEPEAEAVRKLAGIFGLSPQPLLELAGLVEPRTPELREQAIRFAARSEAVVALNRNEREALEMFVSDIKKFEAQAG
jgi:transcriptional regulator with XRE-family HTH domain